MDFSTFSVFPREIATMLIAMIPIGELRASIPIALEVYKLNWVESYIYSVIGNIFPIIFVLWVLEPIYKFFDKKSKLAHRFFEWIFTRTRKKLQKGVDRHGVWALMLFVMIPLPITGAWTGAVAAFIFGLKYKKAMLAITLGVMIAGVIVTLLTLGVAELFLRLTV